MLHIRRTRHSHLYGLFQCNALPLRIPPCTGFNVRLIICFGIYLLSIKYFLHMRAKHINIQIIKHLCITPLRGISRKHPLHSATSCRYDGRISDISKSCNHRTCFCRKAPWARPVFRHPRLRPGIPIACRRGITIENLPAIYPTALAAPHV